MPGVSRGHDDHRLLLVAVGVLGIRLAHEDEDLAALVADAGGPPLVAVDDVGVAVAHDRGLDVGRVRGRHLGLGHGEGRADLALQQRLQVLLLELGAGVALEHLHVAGVGRRAVEGLGGDGRAAHDLAERRVFEIGEAGAAVALGQEQVPEAALARLGLELFQDGRHRPAVGGGVELLLERRLVGIDELVHEVRQLLHVHLGLLGVFEFHLRSPS